MHSFVNFAELYKQEASLDSHDFQDTALPSLDDIKGGFTDIVTASGVPLETISFAYVSGSYSREQQTPFSDLDIECYSPTMQEYQDTLKWRGVLVSLSIYPAGSVRGEGDNIVDRSWARSCFKSAKAIYDPNGEFEACKARFVDNAAEAANENELGLGFWKNMRKVIEYRRKMLGAIASGDQVLLPFATSRFLESYVVAKNILQSSEVSSEKGQFDILAEPTGAGQVLRGNAEKLFQAGLTTEDCITLTAPFFTDLAAVAEGYSPSRNGLRPVPPKGQYQHPDVA